MKCASAAAIVAISLFVWPNPASAQTVGAPPTTEKIPVVDTYHGVTVTDDYRWLEDGTDPKVKAWVAEQNAYTQAYLSKLPQRPEIATFLKNVRQQSHVRYTHFQTAAGKLFALKIDPEKSGMELVVFRSPEDKSSERTVVDLNTLAASKIFQPSWYKVSADGSKVGMALGVGGSDG